MLRLGYMMIMCKPSKMCDHIRMEQTIGFEDRRLHGTSFSCCTLYAPPTQERWESIATQGTSYVVDYHQRPLTLMGDERRLTFLDLIRREEGVNTLPGYIEKVGCEELAKPW